MNSNVSVSEVFSDAWESLKTNWIIILIVAVFSSALLWASLGDMFSNPRLFTNMALLESEVVARNNWSQLVTTIVDCVLTAGVLSGLITYKRTGKVFSFDSFNMPFGTYLKFLFLYIVCGFIIAIGTCCCIVPGVYLAAKLLFAPMCVLDNKNVSIQDTFKMSWHSTDSHIGTMLVLGILSGLLIAIGICCCGIGLWVAGSFVYCLQASVYVALNPKDQEQPPVEEYNI